MGNWGHPERAQQGGGGGGAVVAPPFSANLLSSIGLLMECPKFAEFTGDRVRDVVVALAVAVLVVACTKTVVTIVVDRVCEGGLQDYGEETHYSSEEEEEESVGRIDSMGDGAHGLCSCVSTNLVPVRHQQWDKHQTQIKRLDGAGGVCHVPATKGGGG